MKQEAPSKLIHVLDYGLMLSHLAYNLMQSRKDVVVSAQHAIQFMDTVKWYDDARMEYYRALDRDKIRAQSRRKPTAKRTPRGKTKR